MYSFSTAASTLVLGTASLHPCMVLYQNIQKEALEQGLDTMSGLHEPSHPASPHLSHTVQAAGSQGHLPVGHSQHPG